MYQSIELRSFTKEHPFVYPISYKCKHEYCKFTLYPRFKNIITKDELRKINTHLQVHSKEKIIFTCDDCFKGFSNFEDYKVHLREHSQQELNYNYQILNIRNKENKEKRELKKQFEKQKSNYNVHPVYNDNFFIASCIVDGICLLFS